MKSKIKSYYKKHNCKRICQGDIYRDFTYPNWIWEENTEEGKKIKVQKRTLVYLIILTQDCDLEQDHTNHSKEKIEKQDKFLQSILICPAYLSEQLRAGIHLSDLELKMEKYNSRRWNLIKRNNNCRYHFLPEKPDYNIPDLVIDFKHYYTIPRDTVYENINPTDYLGTINELFRESLSQRFAYYLSRIGLPV